MKTKPGGRRNTSIGALPSTVSDPAYDEYRAANRAYRRAFGRGERHRKLLLKVGAYNAKLKDNA